MARLAAGVALVALLLVVNSAANYDDLELVRPQDYVIASDSYAERGDLPRAVEELDRGIAVFREFAPLHLYAGRMRERAGDPAGALRAYSEAQRLDPGLREAGEAILRITSPTP